MAESYFSCEIFKDGCAVHGCCCSHTTVACSAGLQVPVDTTHWELQISDMHSLESCIWLEILWPNKFHIYAHFTEGYLTNGSFILGTENQHRQQSKQEKQKLTWSPALCERDTAFALALPLSLPAFPPAYKTIYRLRSSAYIQTYSSLHKTN